jgi:hypothetical protein
MFEMAETWDSMPIPEEMGMSEESKRRGCLKAIAKAKKEVS